jgi:quercetin dioxygenase-like cupin family protein
MNNEQAVPETKGVTAEVLATVDLGPEIEGMAGRQLRMRMVTIEPGGVFGPMHDHNDRPGIVYILQGTITDQRNGVATDYGPGVGWPEDRNTTHWLENSGTIPAGGDLGRYRQASVSSGPTSTRNTWPSPLLACLPPLLRRVAHEAGSRRGPASRRAKADTCPVGLEPGSPLLAVALPCRIGGSIMVSSGQPRSLAPRRWAGRRSL